MKKPVIKKVMTLKETRFLNMYQAVYDNKMGQEKNWFIASRKTEDEMAGQLLEGKPDQVDAVLIAAIHEAENKLVLIRQYRVPLNAYIYELPAGLIDKGEEMLTAAARELKEETGLTVVDIDEKRTHKQAYLSPGMTDESVGVVYCRCTGSLSKSFMEADEDIIPMLVSKEEAKKILESDEKIDIKALMALQQFVMA